jgi:hypothetical protein
MINARAAGRLIRPSYVDIFGMRFIFESYQVQPVMRISL